MQQQMQRSEHILPDIFTCRDAAVRKVGLMKENPFPGKREQKAAAEAVSGPEGDDETQPEQFHTNTFQQCAGTGKQSAEKLS